MTLRNPQSFAEISFIDFNVLLIKKAIKRILL